MRGGRIRIALLCKGRRGVIPSERGFGVVGYGVEWDGRLWAGDWARPGLRSVVGWLAGDRWCVCLSIDLSCYTVPGCRLFSRP